MDRTPEIFEQIGDGFDDVLKTIIMDKSPGEAPEEKDESIGDEEEKKD